MAFGLNELLGGVGKWVENTGKGIVNMFGSGIAGVRDLGSLITTGKLGDETSKWQMYMTGADNARDAQIRSAGQALNSATNLTDIALALGSGGTSKMLSSGAGAIATNALQGAAGGFADSLEVNGANWNQADTGNRMLSGMITGAATAGLNNKMSAAVGKSGNKLLNNKFTQSAFGRGAMSGALGGAVGGGTMTALNGGSLEDIIGNAFSTGAAGALTGGVTSSMMNGASKLGSKAIDKIWTAEQNQSFQNAISNPSNMKSPIYLGEISDNSLGNIKTAYEKAGIDFNNDNVNAMTVKDGKLYLTQDGARHLNQRRIQQDQMTSKQVRQTMRNATTNGVVSPELTNRGNATMGAQNGSKYDIAHLGVNENGNLDIKTAYQSNGGQITNQVKTALAGSQPASYQENPNLASETSALQGGNQNIPQQKQNVNNPESYQGKNLRLKSAEALLDQYGTIDKPMARSANAIENVQRVADAGFTKPGEVEDIISKVTGSNGKVTKLTRTLVNTAQPVDTVSDIDRIVNEQIALNGLTDTSHGKAIKATIDAQLNRLESRRNGSITGTDAPEDVFDVIKALETRSADLKGKSGNNYRLTTPERTDQARVIDSVTEILKDRLYSGADMSKIMTPETAAELKSFAPKNKKWVNYVDNTIMKARDIGELRSTMAPFVNMGKVIENQYMNYGTYGSQMSQTAKSNRSIAGKLSDIPVVGKVAGPLAEITFNSNLANRVRANAYAKAANIADSAASKTNTTDTTIMQTQNPKTSLTQQSISPRVEMPTTSLPNTYYNMLGRETGEQQADQVSSTMSQAPINTSGQQVQELQALAAQMNQRPEPTYRLEDGMEVTIDEVGEALEAAANAGDAMAYNQLSQIYTTLQAAQGSGVAGVVNNSTSGIAGNDILGQLQQASYMALLDGDVKAFSTLASLYESAKKMYGAEQKELSSSDRTTLQNLNNSMNSLDQLESLYTAAGGGKGIAGNLDNVANFFTGGAANYNLSTYNAAKESLGMAIVKNFVNLGATESDAKRYAAMLPEITDTPEMAQQKISTLRSLIQQAQQGVYASY